MTNCPDPEFYALVPSTVEDLIKLTAVMSSPSNAGLPVDLELIYLIWRTSQLLHGFDAANEDMLADGTLTAPKKMSDYYSTEMRAVIRLFQYRIAAYNFN